MKKKKQEKKKLPKKGSATEPLPTAPPDFTQESLFSLIPDLICTLSPDGRFTNPNHAWEKVLGYSEEELSTVPYVAFLHPDDIPLTVAAIEKAISGSQIIEFFNRLRGKDGTYRWLHWMVRTTNVPKEVFVHAKDITRQRETERSLEKKERTLNALREKGSFIFLSLDLTGMISGENNKFSVFTGYSEETISRKLFADFVAPEDKEKLRNFFLQIKHGDSKPLEVLLVHREGFSIPVMLTGFVVQDPEGSAHVLYLIIHDLSGQRKVLGKLKERENFLKEILEVTKDAVLFLDNEGKIKYSNSRFNGLWGIPEEMLGVGEEENLLGFVVRRLQELKVIHKKVSELGNKSNDEQDFIEFNDGRTFEIQVVSLVSENDISGRVVFMRDRTEEVKQEREITASEMKFHTLTELSLEMIFVAREGVIQYANPRVESLTGYSRGEFCSMNLKDLAVTAPESRHLFEENLRLILSGHRVDPFEYIMIRKDGERITTIISMTEVNIGTERLVAFFVSDINYYKKSEITAIRKMESVESYHQLMIGRELKMIELKKEINKLLVLLGENEKYRIVE